MAGSLYNAVYGTAGNATTGALGNQTYANGAIITANTGNGGLTIGGAANQKIGLWGATPIIKPSGTGELLGLNGFANTAIFATNMNSNGNTGNTAYTFNDVIKALKTSGILTA